MSDFDPDKYLADKTSGAFDPDAYLAAHPAEKAKPSLVDALRRGATQGATLGYSDELVGVLSAPILKAIGKLSGNRAYESAFADKPLEDLYRESRDADRAGNAAAEHAHGGAYLASNVAGSLLPMMVTGAPASLGQATGLGAAMGLGSSDADLTRGEYVRAGIDTGLGAGIGAATHGLVKGGEKFADWLAGKAASAEASMAEAAARKAAAETATARSEAGQAAQGAYRTLEHLRELGAKQPELLQGLLETVPGLADHISGLETELLGKSASKLGGDVARKEATAAALSAAAAAEPERAAAALGEKLGAKGASAGLRGYLKKAAIRSAVGAGAGALAGSLSGHPGAGAGAGVFGMNTRLGPTIMKQLTSQPMQRLMYSAGAKTLGALLRGEEPAMISGAERVVGPALEDVVAGQVPRLRSALGLGPKPDEFDPDQYLQMKTALGRNE